MLQKLDKTSSLYKFINHQQSCGNQIQQVLLERARKAADHHRQLQKLIKHPYDSGNNYFTAEFPWCDLEANVSTAGLSIAQLVSHGDLTFVSDISVARPIPHNDPTWHPLGFWSKQGTPFLVAVDRKRSTLSEAMLIETYVHPILRFAKEHTFELREEDVQQVLDTLSQTDAGSIWQTTVGMFGDRWMRGVRARMFSYKIEQNYWGNVFYPHLMNTLKAYLSTLDVAEIKKLKVLVIGSAGGLLLQMIDKEINSVCEENGSERSNHSIIGLEPIAGLVKEAKDKGLEVQQLDDRLPLPYAADSFNIVVDLYRLSQGLGLYRSSDMNFNELYRVSCKLGSGVPCLTIVATPTQVLPSPRDIFMTPFERLGNQFFIAGLLRPPIIFDGSQFQPIVQDHYVLQALSPFSHAGPEENWNRSIDLKY